MGRFSIKGLIKFGQKEHLEALLNDGIIYMNNIDYFRKYEESKPEHLRGDRYECFDYISQQNKIMVLGEQMWEVDDITVFENRNTYPGYLYCMYALYADSNYCVDGRMLDFGEYAVIIKEPLEFIRRIQKACAKEHIIPNCYPVRYYNEKTEKGLLSPFLKRDKYYYQHEARIYIHKANPQENMVLKIGPIKDIAYLVKCRKIESSEIL